MTVSSCQNINKNTKPTEAARGFAARETLGTSRKYSKHTLLLIDNNLKHDNRVRRHVRSILDLGQRVTVLATPYPEACPGFEQPGMRMLFFNNVYTSLDPSRLHQLTNKLNVTNEIFQAFPGIFASIDTNRPMVALQNWIQTKQIECSWWDDFHPSCKLDIDPINDYLEVVRYFDYMLQLAETACELQADTVYCNDLQSLIAGVAHKKRYHSRLIFDAHEIYYDMAPGGQTKLWKQSIALLEFALVRHADYVIGVSQSHVDWMRKHYRLGANAVCVPNVFGMGQEVSRPAKRQPSTPLRIYYHGASDPFRGLEPMARSLALVPGVELTLRCFPSDTLEKTKLLAKELGIESRMHFLPLISIERMIETIRAEADVGIHACELPTAVNLKVALANKFAEYLLAGIPIITSPLQEQARIVTKHRLGYVLPDNSPEEIAKSLRWMLEHRDEIPDMGQRAYDAGVQYFSWKNILPTLQRTLTE